MIIVTLIVFFCLQAFVLFCCLAAGNDPGSQKVSDQEQMEYIKTWMKIGSLYNFQFIFPQSLNQALRLTQCHISQSNHLLPFL